MSSVLARVSAATVVVWCAFAGSDLRAAQDWRALAVASFDEAWQVINDSYFDPTFGGVDWPQVRAELRPKVTSAQNPDQVREIVRDMIGRLRQSHFVLLAPGPGDERPVGPATLPIEVRLIRNLVIITAVAKDSDAWRVGLRPGMSIDEIDGAAMRTVVGNPASRGEQLQAWRRVVASLHGADGSSAQITVAPPSNENRVQIGTVARLRVGRVREAGQEASVGNLPPMLVRTTVSERRTAGNRLVGVIGFNVWMTAVASPFAAAVDKYRHADGLVIDLRGNPGGLAEMIRGLAGHVLAEPALLGRMRTRAVDLEFRANPRRSTDDGRRVEPFAGPVAILVDGLTGSASECFAGGLQSLGRARVFGETTMGQALPAVTRRLPNGDVLLYAIGDFVTSTGQRLEGRGVIPDEVVPLSVAELWEGRDGVLDAAVAWVDRQRTAGSR